MIRFTLGKDIFDGLVPAKVIMQRVDLREDVWDQYTVMMLWLMEHFGDSEYWESSIFEPKKTKPNVIWYIGTHRRNWYSNTQDICIWMPDDVYTAFTLRFAR